METEMEGEGNREGRRGELHSPLAVYKVKTGLLHSDLNKVIKKKIKTLRKNIQSVDLFVCEEYHPLCVHGALELVSGHRKTSRLTAGFNEGLFSQLLHSTNLS